MIKNDRQWVRLLLRPYTKTAKIFIIKENESMNLKSINIIGKLKEADNCSLNLIYTEMYEMALQWNDVEGANYLVGR